MTPVDTPADVRIKNMLPEPPPPQKSSCLARIFHHRSQYFVAGGSVLTIIGGVYTWVKQDIFSAALFTASFIVEVVAFTAIGCLTPQKDLEDQLDFYKTKLLESKDQEDILDKNVRELNEAKDAMAKEVIEARSMIEELGKMLNQDSLDFKEFSTKIENFQQPQLEIYKRFKEIIFQLKWQLEDYKKLNQTLQTKIQDLKGVATIIEGNEKNLVNEVEKLETNIRELKKGNEERGTQLQELQEFGNNFRTQVASMAQQVNTLVEKMGQFDLSGWKELTLSISDLKAVVNKLEGILK